MEGKEYEKYINKVLLINSVKKRPVLWDKTLDVYKDKAAKAAAWREICVLLMKDFGELKEHKRQEFGKLVIKKWSQTRDAWIRTVNEKKKSNKSGAASVNTRPYIYHNQMLFLKKVVDTGEEEDTIILEEHKAFEKGDEISEHIHDTQEERHYSPRTQPCAVKRKFTEDEKNTNISNTDQVDRHLSFFKSLLPSLAFLDDDQTLDFHSGVITLLQNIKRRRVGHSVYDWSTPHIQTSGESHHYQIEGCFSGLRPDSAQSPSSTHSQDSKLSEDPLYSQHKFK